MVTACYDGLVPAAASPRLQTFAAILAISVFAGVLFLPLLTGAKTLYFADLSLYFIPLLAFQRRELLLGRIPLWNPYLLCGTPFLGNPQAGPFYPSSLLLVVLPAHLVVGVTGALHCAFAAVGTLLFLRRRGFGLAASLLGALAFGFSGALVSKMQFPNMVQAAAFLPWLLWAVEGVFRESDTRRIVRQTAILAFLIGLALLAAHPQMFLMQFYLIAAWSAWRAGSLRGASEGRVRLFAIAAAFVVGGALGAGQLLPVVDFIRSTVRAGLPLEKANRFYLPPSDLLSVFVLPNLRGNPGTGVFTGPGNFWERCAYIGLLPFTLAVFGVISRFRVSAETRFWTITAFVALWLAVGKIGGLYAVAFYLLPGLSKFHDAARWLHVATFALACLAAAGWQAAVTARPSLTRHARGIAVGVLLLTAVDLFAFDRTLNPMADSPVFARRPEPAVTSLAREERLYHADLRRVWRRFAGYRTYGPPGTRTAEATALLHSLGPNLPMYFGARDAGGYEPVRRADTASLLGSLTEQVDRRGTDAPLLRAVGATAVAFLPSDGQGAAALRPVPGASARAHLWERWQTAATPKESLALVTNLAWNGTPVVVGAASSPLTTAGSSVPLIVRDSDPQRVTVSLPAAHRGGLVVVADTLHPGWEATVDGREAPIYSANGVFRAVSVPAGAKQIEFRYQPSAASLGLFISLCAAGTLTGMMVFSSVGRVSRTAAAAVAPPQ